MKTPTTYHQGLAILQARLARLQQHHPSYLTDAGRKMLHATKDKIAALQSVLHTPYNDLVQAQVVVMIEYPDLKKEYYDNITQ